MNSGYTAKLVDEITTYINRLQHALALAEEDAAATKREIQQLRMDGKNDRRVLDELAQPVQDLLRGPS